ncbi:homoserine O-acetyltransferase/O-succinyltransferase family protein [Catenovulum sediminis]|uniref:homoserine O-acetyltransferase/O-succinyltransferase family protein n=1 Tax=Catenovulum sediminis TaxID=1740262 RepID=UPI00117CC247|nr:homoserine O-succinyltransferase [Catenovulum sediminis]
MCLRLGVINLMPNPECYQQELLALFGQLDIKVNCRWIRLTDKSYQSANSSLSDYSFFSSIKLAELDAVIVTGAPVELLPFEEVVYWQELITIVQQLMQRQIPVLGLCWGAMALAKLIGVDKKQHSSKIFGVYPLIATNNAINNATSITTNIATNISANTSSTFGYNPFSTYASFSQQDLELLINKGDVLPIYQSPQLGTTHFATRNGLLTMCLSHPEYTSQRLQQEWVRDQARNDVDPPVGLTASITNKTADSSYWLADSINIFTDWFARVRELNHQALPPKALQFES